MPGEGNATRLDEALAGDSRLFISNVTGVEMNHGNPPRVATWIFQHLRPAGCDEALAGDLLEEFRSGRSRGWYWLQIIAALAIEWSQSAWQRRNWRSYLEKPERWS